MFKGVIIFGAGLYTGVYIAQNYQDAASYVCRNTNTKCNEVLKRDCGPNPNPKAKPK